VRQADVKQRGHAIEVRVYAEDPARGFLPSPGPLRVYRPPVAPGIRVDDGVCEGDVVSTFYDPMIAKLSAWAPDRTACIGRLIAALNVFEIAGIQHNIAHLLQILDSQAFRSGRYDTGIVKTLPPLPPSAEDDPFAAALAALVTHRARQGVQAGAPTAESAWAMAARVAGLRSR
jgi:acetyl/propionyl-CoA carboxylase alpha subunit